MYNVAVIGHGYWGSKMADRISNNRSMNLKYVVDENPIDLDDHGKLVKEDIALNDYEVDIVGIFTPPHTHYGIARRALENRKHVLVTKPFVLEHDQAIELFELAEKEDRYIFVDYTYLYSPIIRKLKELIDFNPVYIDYVNANRWTGCGDPGVSVVQDLVPHIISILMYLFDTTNIEIVDVKSVSVASEDDMVYSTLFINDVMVNLTLGWAYPNKERKTVIIGKDKMISGDASAIIKIQDTISDGAKIVTTGVNEIHCGGEPLQIQLEEIIDVMNGKESKFNMKDIAINVTRITEEIDDQRKILNNWRSRDDRITHS